MSPAKYPDKLGEDADGTDQAKATAKHAENIPEDKREGEETDQMGGTPPQESSGILPADACCK